MKAKFIEYNIHGDDYNMHGPGKYYGYLDTEWSSIVTQKKGSIELFEAFLETANSDVLK